MKDRKKLNILSFWLSVSKLYGLQISKLISSRTALKPSSMKSLRRLTKLPYTDLVMLTVRFLTSSSKRKKSIWGRRDFNRSFKSKFGMKFESNWQRFKTKIKSKLYKRLRFQNKLWFPLTLPHNNSILKLLKCKSLLPWLKKLPKALRLTLLCSKRAFPVREQRVLWTAKRKQKK